MTHQQLSEAERQYLAAIQERSSYRGWAFMGLPESRSAEIQKRLAELAELTDRLERQIGAVRARWLYRNGWKLA